MVRFRSCGPLRATTLRTMTKIFDEKQIHLIFEVGLWLKGLFAVAETAAGVASYFVSKQFLVSLVDWVTRSEFAEDPQDAIANDLRHSVQALSLGSQDFAALYLVGHGIVKLWLIAGLLRRKLWYYPVALTVFGFFIVYQLYRYTLAHSAWLLLISALDAVVIALTWHEYRHLLQRMDSNKEPSAR